MFAIIFLIQIQLGSIILIDISIYIIPIYGRLYLFRMIFIGYLYLQQSRYEGDFTPSSQYAVLLKFNTNAKQSLVLHMNKPNDPTKVIKRSDRNDQKGR